MANSPVHKITVGGVSIAIWENDSDKGFKTYSLGPPTKNYMSKDKQWKTTNNIKAAEILAAITAYQRAFEWLYVKDTSNFFDSKPETSSESEI